MECLNCGNCKTGSYTYYCLMKNELVVNETNINKVVEKSRSGWKKGTPGYEVHRRSTRKDLEV